MYTKVKYKILVASTNKHKVEEIKKILDSGDILFESLQKFPHIGSVEENGDTFEANAILKAKYYNTCSRLSVIADDSGLVVPSLNGEPGVLSARYAGIKSSYAENNRLLLSRLSGFKGEQRFAYFVCIAVYYDGKNLISAEGRAEGKIINRPRGENGFGYDPLFYYPPAQKTFAEMEEKEKNRVSHRYRALKLLKRKLEKIHWNNA